MLPAPIVQVRLPGSARSAPGCARQCSVWDVVGDRQGRSDSCPRSVRRAVCDQGRKPNSAHPPNGRIGRSWPTDPPERATRSGQLSRAANPLGGPPHGRDVCGPGAAFQRKADARPARFAAHHGSSRLSPRPAAFSCPVLDLICGRPRGRLQCAHSVEHLVLFDDHPRDGEHDERRRHHKRHPLERTGDPLEASGPVAQLDEASWAHDRTAAPSAA